MKTNNKGWDQCGNAQAVVDGAHQIIIAADVTNQTNDKRQVQPMLSEARANLGEDQTIEKATLDHGYYSEENVIWLENEKMAWKLRTAGGRAIYALRKQIVEPVFGQIKQVRNFRQFLLRGLAKMQGEWSLICLTHNLLKLFGARDGIQGFLVNIRHGK
jgi:hypothetical protein